MSKLRKGDGKTPRAAPEVVVPGTGEAEAAEGAADGEEGLDGDRDSGGKRFPRGRMSWDKMWREIKKGNYG